MTKRANNEGSIRQRPDGRWEARYSAGYDGGTGKLIRRSIYGDTQAEVRKKLNAIIKSIDDGNYTPPNKMTVGEWFDTWLSTYVKPTLKPHSVRSYEAHIKNHIKPAIGAFKLSEAQPLSLEIQKLYNKLLEKDPPLSPKTIKNLHGVIHKGFAQAAKLQLISRNPADNAELPRCQKKEIKPLDNAEIAAFLRAIKGSRYEILFILTLFTGLRESEIIGLTWDSVDLDSGKMNINKQLQLVDGEYVTVTPKNGKTRTITLPLSMRELLREQKIKQAEQQTAAGSAWNNSGDFVFTDEIGRNYFHRNIYNAFKRIVKGIGIPEARFHDLRHSYAVAALRAGDDIKTVQENLGHHTAAFTLDIYGHVTESMKAESAGRMDRFYKSVSDASITQFRPGKNENKSSLG